MKISAAENWGHTEPKNIACIGRATAAAALPATDARATRQLSMFKAEVAATNATGYLD